MGSNQGDAAMHRSCRGDVSDIRSLEMLAACSTFAMASILIGSKPVAQGCSKPTWLKSRQGVHRGPLHEPCGHRSSSADVERPDGGGEHQVGTKF